MFNRFTRAARRTVTVAQTEARRMGSASIGTEHLLLGLLAETETAAAGILGRLAVTVDQVEREIERSMRRGGLGDEDIAALESIGVRPEEIRREVEAAFGEGALRPADGRNLKHLPFTERSKRVLERTLREAQDVRSKSVEPEHLLMALLGERDGLAADVLRRLGIAPDFVREQMQGRLRRAS